MLIEGDKIWINLDHVRCAVLGDEKFTIFFTGTDRLSYSIATEQEKVEPLIKALEAAARLSPSSAAVGDTGFMVKKKMVETNFDRIKEMSAEKFADVMGADVRPACPPLWRGDACPPLRGSCKDCWLMWLKEEVAENVD